MENWNFRTQTWGCFLCCAWFLYRPRPCEHHTGAACKRKLCGNAAAAAEELRSRPSCDGHRLVAKIGGRHEPLRTTATHYAAAAGATRRRGSRERATALAHLAARGPSGSGSALADRARAGQLRATARAQRAMGDACLAARAARSPDLHSAG